jgi:hypothetical protein
MRWSFGIGIALLIMSCSPPEQGLRDALMDRLEREVHLPQGARSIEKYARYYADSGDGEFTAIYLIPTEDEIGPGVGCAELGADSISREVPCRSTTRPAWAIEANERRWLRDKKDLPFQCDGGCSQVTVVFDKAKSVVKSARCNGSL